MSDAIEVRFGVLCESHVVPEWQARAIEKLVESRGAVLAAWIRPSDACRTPARRSGFAYRLVCDGLLMPSLLETRDVSQMSSIARQIDWDGQAEAAEAVRGYGLDFILDFRSDPRPGDDDLATFEPLARHGVWKLRVADDPDTGFGTYAVFRAILRSKPVVGAELTRSGAVIARALYRVHGHSFAATCNSVLNGMSVLPARACADLRNGDSSSIASKPSAASRTAPGVLSAPSAFDVARFSVKTLGLIARRLFDGLFRHNGWNVGIVRAPISRFLDPDWRPRIEWLPAPLDHTFRADPFGIERDGRVYLMYEDFTYAGDIGRIGWAVLDRPGVPALGIASIGGPSHLSYPYLFEHEGAIYCVPESSQTNEVALYRAVEFPHRWEKVATLLEGVAGCDSTVFRHDDRWWLACTDQRAEPNVHLSLWHAPRLEGPWTAHRRNPVKSDPRSARPAGTPFIHRGQLYRPAQDSSESYGRRVVINRVVRLTPDEFEEMPEVAVGPFTGTRYPDGVHTLSAAGNFTIVDGRRTCFDARAFLAAVARGWTQRRRRAVAPRAERAAHAALARAD